MLQVIQIIQVYSSLEPSVDHVLIKRNWLYSNDLIKYNQFAFMFFFVCIVVFLGVL